MYQKVAIHKRYDFMLLQAALIGCFGQKKKKQKKKHFTIIGVFDFFPSLTAVT